MSFIPPRVEPPIESLNELLEYFERAARPASERLVGIEVESLPVRPADGGAVGLSQVLDVLERIGERGGYEPVAENGRTVHLTSGARNVGLEPGGQLELSGSPYRNLADALRELDAHFNLVSASSGGEVAWLALGEQPFATLHELPWMPKERYRIMSAFLASRGDLGHHMMKKTATLQASFDFTSAEDAMDLLRTTLRLTPVLIALTANSPYADGVSTGFLSHRTAVWAGTDPARSGRFPAALQPSFQLEQYVDHVLDLPVIFRRSGSQWVPGDGRTFRQLMKPGRDGGPPPTLFDWELHLSTFFPDARLKKVVEVRGADCPPRHLMMPLVAFLKGILYGARDAVRELLGGLTAGELGELQIAASRDGLRAEACGVHLRDVARRLVDAAAEALSQRGGADSREGEHLAPLQEMVARGASPADELLVRFGDRPQDRAGLVAATSI